jgi:hypothetical protein
VTTLLTGFRLPRPALLFLILSSIWLATVGCGEENGLAGIPAGADLLFAEEFAPGEVGEWHLEGDEQGQAHIFDERLLIEINAPNTVQYATLEQPSFTDFVLQVDITRLAGSLDSTAGLLFRVAGPQQFYRFAVTGNGLYIVERHNEDGTWTRLIPEWEETDALQPGLEATNRLAVRAAQGTFSFYANDQLLTEVVDGQYSTGQIALSAGTYGEPGLRIAYDNLVVREP